MNTNAKLIKTIWITVLIDRHADFGGGQIEADLPDTPYHRAFYADRIVRRWTQFVEA